MASVLLLLPATKLTAQQPTPADSKDSSPVYQAYQEQLKENERRLSGIEDAYQQQLQANQAAQIYMPPVHISPQFPPRRTRQNRSLNGRVNSVQNYVAPNRPAFASLSDEQRSRSPSVAARPRPKRDAAASDYRPAPASSTEHVFLQDRIANALSRTFSRKSKTKEAVFSSATIPVRKEDLSPSVRPRTLEQPALDSDDLEQYASNEVENWYGNSPSAEDEEQRASDEEIDQSLSSVLDRQDSMERQADLELADDEPPRVFLPENPMQDASRVVPSSYEVKRRSSKASARVAKRTHRMKAPHPVSYRPKQNKLRASERSILVGQEEESLDDVDFDLPLDRKGSQDGSSDEEFSSPLRPKAGSGTKSDQRDDLESVEDDDRESDRIRSRLDDDLDDLDDLDDIDDEDFDDDDTPVERPTDRPCNDFRDELLSTSIRDISLDISPGAYSETSRHGGPIRSWTDRSGNVIANGAMVDLRRGYVILDSGQKIPYAKLGVADLAAVSEFWRLPTVCLLGNRGGSPYRSWTPQTVTWKASSLCHKPLYFENRQLERYGHSRGPFAQPIHSTAHFFVSLISLPYQTAINPANECQYALGFFRPGDCAPWLKDPIPISLEGAKRQALLTTGGAFIP